MVTKFAANVQRLIQGSENFESLIQQCRPAYQRFRHNIRRTSLNFQPFVDAEDAENSCGSRGLHIKVEAYPDEESTDDNSLDAVPPVYLRSIKENIQKYDTFPAM